MQTKQGGGCGGTVQTKYIIFGEVLKDRGQKYEQTLRENFRKALKWPLQYANFEKFFGGACPRPGLP